MKVCVSSFDHLLALGKKYGTKTTLVVKVCQVPPPTPPNFERTNLRHEVLQHANTAVHGRMANVLSSRAPVSVHAPGEHLVHELDEHLRPYTIACRRMS